MKKIRKNLRQTSRKFNFFNNFRFIIVICIPLFIYFGEKSFIAFDEGYYALQGKWVLDYNNWITPQWFDQVQFDRTPFLPVLIASHINYLELVIFQLIYQYLFPR